MSTATIKKKERRDWSSVEVEQLLTLMKDHTSRETAKILGRAPSSVWVRYARAIRPQTATDGAPKQRTFRSWTEEELAILIEMWPNHSATEIALVLGRVRHHVGNRGRLLKLKKSESFLLKHPKSRHLAYPPELNDAIKLVRQIESKLNEHQDHS